MVAHSLRSGSHSQLVPALGETWGHSCTVRVVLLRDSGTRRAVLLKSPSKREASVPYLITVSATVIHQLFLVGSLHHFCHWLHYTLSLQPSGVRDAEVDPVVTPVGVSPGGTLDDLTADLEEQEIQELLAEQERDGEEVEQRSKRPHLDSCPDATSGRPLSTLHVHQPA